WRRPARKSSEIVQGKRQTVSIDREDVIEQLLKRQGPGGEATPTGCVDAETLAAWMEGALSTAESDAVETHAASCARCQQLLAGVARAALPVAEARPKTRLAHWRWLVPLTASAAALTFWILLPQTRVQDD